MKSWRGRNGLGVEVLGRGEVGLHGRGEVHDRVEVHGRSGDGSMSLGPKEESLTFLDGLAPNLIL